MKIKGLTLRIIIYILTSVTIVFGLIYRLNYISSKEILENQIEQSANYLRSSTVQNVEKVLSSIEKVPQSIAQSIESSYYTEDEMHNLLVEMLNRNKDIFGISIAFEPNAYYKDKEFFAPYIRRDSSKIKYMVLGGKDYNYFFMDWYQIPKECDTLTWSEPYFDEGGGNIAMTTYSVPFYKKIDGEKIFNGVVTADVSLEWLQKTISSIKVLETGYGILISKTGRVVTHPISKYIMNESVFSIADDLNSPEMREMGRKMISGEIGSFKMDIRNLKNGKPSRTYYAPITLNGWSIGIIYPEDELMQDVTKLNKNVLFMGIAGLVLIMLVVIFISRNITKPIRLLTDATQEFANGNFNVELPDIQSKDEIGHLSITFKHMRDDLKQTIQNLKQTSGELKISNEKLEEYSKTLEIKVEERTAEIKKKNCELQSTLEKLKDTQNQLIMQEKMASLGGLTAGIAHEIKNPLNFVNNFSELSVEITDELEEELNKNISKLSEKEIGTISDLISDLKLNLTKINEHGKRADSIVKGMLLHSRGKSGERQLTDINALLDEYVKLAYHGMRAQDSSFNIKLITNYDDSIKQISVVPQDISRVFLNVINNACYAAFERKKMTSGDFTPTVEISSKRREDFIEIRIKDNGIGIPNDNLNKIFNPFFTTKPTGKGTGLGLSLSYDIVTNEHKGEISVSSEQNNFTEFLIKLPNN